MERIYLDRDWKFAEEYCDEMAEVAYDESAMEDVLIPHNVKNMPLHYFDESIYQMVSGYRRHIKIEKEWKGKSILLTFAGVAHQATVYVNGQEVAKHHCGYTAFTTDIAEYVNYDKDNVITVRCDSNENLNQPPFGFAIDYMTYGGIYRDVYLEVKEASHISRIAIDTKLSDRYEEDGLMYCKRSAAYSKVHIVNPSDSMKLVQYLRRKGQGEYYKAQDRIKVYIVEVKTSNKGPRILVSRTHPELVKKLFEEEVSEVRDGIVEIKSISREAGSRTKIAVWSNDEDVDPVGACVGQNGARVNAIVNELRGEKIDIVEWDENPAYLIENALSPAKVVAVVADADEKSARVVVPDYQLSLAIGKEGQNARLAARLTGFKIDIKSETQAREAGDFIDLDDEYYDDEDEYYDEDGEFTEEEYSDDEYVESEESSEEE